MKILGIIPSRFASSRFPGKPLAEINGKSMIQRVYEQSCKSALVYKIIVATDDERIYNHVKSFGGNVMMTASQHQSGTDRCAEVLQNEKQHVDAVINIQGDEPFIDPKQIDLIAHCLQPTETQIATLVKEISTVDELKNFNTPKVVIDENDNAIYFSRQPIPFVKGFGVEEWLNRHCYYKHIGIYGYKSVILLQLAKLSPSQLEIAESLEQLRWIENGYKIKTAVTTIDTIAIDTPQDLQSILITLGK